MKLPLPPRVSWVFVVLLLSVLAALGLTPTAQASHIRAGDIQAKSDTTLPASARNPRRFFFKMVLYRDRSGVEENRSTFFFGDGTSVVVERGVERQISPDTDINIFYFEHTYNAPRSYTVSYVGENRNPGVRNMSDSGFQTFYISTRIIIAPELNVNSSPVLNAPAFDKAGNNQVWLHNPAASDADGDSLAFELQPSRQIPGGIPAAQANGNTPNPAVTPNFVYPNLTTPRGVQVPYLGNAGGGASTFTQDPQTGQVVWNAPNQPGLYNFAFIVREYRRSPNGRAILIGEVIRDMQIVVEPTRNLRPTITIPPDLCVIAGTPITAEVTATDPDNDPIGLEAFGGIFPPATFTQGATGPPVARGTFRWTPQCTDVASDPYTVLFKASDRPPAGGTVLIDEKPWRIRVIGPPPINLQARRQDTRRALLTWDRYVCQVPGATIRVYRREGPSNFNPDSCETGIPASSGFVLVNSVPVTAQSFIDDRNGLGLERGKNYCYRIYVEFPRPKGGASIASQEACVPFDGRPALLTNVTVDQTAANGQITVRWTRPSNGTTGTSFNQPVRYQLFRGQGTNPTVFTSVLVRDNNLNDTTFVDNQVNTAAFPYTYRLIFSSKTLPEASDTARIREAAPAASSVRLSGRVDTVQVGNVLTWTYDVPWDNSTRPTTIFRRSEGDTGPFVQIGTVTPTRTTGTFTDRNVVAGRTYCYYVSTNGTYNDPTLPDPLINLSQELCISPVPCRPQLSIRVINCDSLSANLFNLPATTPNIRYNNALTWEINTNTPPGCNQGVAYYRIFARPAADSSSAFTLRDSTTQRSYVDRDLASAAYCYRVQAVDSLGQRSALSNVACNDNCLLFLLPNIFTPNGDGRNDTFRPKVYSPLRRTKVQIFNRWGVKVYESDRNPLIEWPGTGDAKEGSTGVKVTEGTYYYLAEVEFDDRNRTKRTFKGWVEITR